MKRASLAVLGLVLLTSAAGVRHGAVPDRIQTHDNERAAGTLEHGVLRLNLEARAGQWFPHGADGPSVEMLAFAEVGRPLQIPGPLIRVPAGTQVIVSIRNSLPDSTLTVHGLVSRPVKVGSSPDTVRIPPGASREVRFRLDAPGAFYYWGTTMGRALRFRTGTDGQLSGAIIVDEGGSRTRNDRVLVFGEWADSVGGEGTLAQRRLLLVINGRTWPHTSRFHYQVGDSVRFRMLNTSAEVHPMHLHGFYFRVDSRGDGIGDTTYAESDRDMVVTDRMTPGSTASITWVPERPGNWLFHCHFTVHFAARAPLGLRLTRADHVARRTHAGNHALEGMSGLVMGVEVAPRPNARGPEQASDAGRRRLRLLVRPAGGTDIEPFYSFTLHERNAEPAIDSTVRNGPPIILKRNEPVSITVINRTSEPTAVHWHGIELDSYFDGVAGFSGDSRRLSPLIPPTDSFVARFTPPRSGTFIYHTHVDEPRQQPAGLSGALLVVDEDKPYDPSTDIPVLITTPRSAETARSAVLLNGRLDVPPVALRIGVPHRFRLINITIGRPGIRVEVRRDTSLVQWRALAKDGADLPDEARVTAPARRPITIGETYDFELTPLEAGAMRLEVRSGAGALLATMALIVR